MTHHLSSNRTFWVVVRRDMNSYRSRSIFGLLSQCSLLPWSPALKSEAPPIKGCYATNFYQKLVTCSTLWGAPNALSTLRMFLHKTTDSTLLIWKMLFSCSCGGNLFPWNILQPMFGLLAQRSLLPITCSDGWISLMPDFHAVHLKDTNAMNEPGVTSNKPMGEISLKLEDR